MSARGIALALAAACAAAALPAAPAAAQDLAVRAGVVHPVDRAPIQGGVVLVLGGRIAAVGPAAEVEVPAGVRTLEAAVVTPGLIDARSVVGLAGYLNQPHDQEQLERSEPMQPELSAVDAYDPREPLIAWVRGFGVTTLHTGHAPGAVISGRTLIAKTRGDTVEQAVIRPYAALACTLGDAAERAEGAPGTRAKAAALLRAELQRAREYKDRRERATAEEPVARDLRLEALLPVLAGEVPLWIAADRARDLATALRIAREFDVRVVLDGAAEAHLALDAIAEAGVAVALHPTMRRPMGDAENLSMETAARLRERGIPFALESGYETYVPRTRVVLFEAAVAAANGLPFDAALSAITLDAARLLAIDDRVGSLTPGKDGDLALYDGDPFETTTRCVGVVIEGVVVSEAPR